MNDYTLVAYIGDHNIVEKREETLRQKRDKILGSLSMHANLQERAKNRTNTNTSLHAVHGGYNTISGTEYRHSDMASISTFEIAIITSWCFCNDKVVYL